jgi:hypothetical protein
MTICILAFETGAICWFLIMMLYLVLFVAFIKVVAEEDFFGKYSMIVAAGLSVFSFLGLFYIVTHNKTFAYITDNTSSRSLIALVLYASFPGSLIVTNFLGVIVKILRGKE